MTEERIDVERLFRARPSLKEIFDRLSRAGHDVALVGGVVRDAILARLSGGKFSRPKAKEIDLATSARPGEIKRLFPDWRAIEVGEAFGVLRLIAPDGQEYEVATYRREADYDGRWPGKVEPASALEEDLKRRDLTINGLAARADGRVIDLVGGVADLKERLIRTIGDPEERFSEDYLRIIRAIRFACLIDGRLTREVSAALKRNGAKLLSISRERLRDELFKLLETPKAAKGIELLDDHGLLELLLPEVVATKGVKQPEKYHPEGDVYTHTLLALEVADLLGFEPLVKFAILLHDIGKPVAFERNGGQHMGGHELIGEELAEGVGRRFRLSNDQIKIIKYLIREHLRIAKLPEMTRPRQIRFIREAAAGPGIDFSSLERKFPLFFKLLQLLLADCEASVHRSSGWLPVFQTFVGLLPHLKRLEELEAAHKLLDGHDLLEMGVPQGPQVGRILEEVYDQILSGRVQNREEALKLARELAETRGAGRSSGPRA
ncbi:MAG: CCA tRNA nucleotidyltransferase [Candidatus Bipolaricaulia bacterium]